MGKPAAAIQHLSKQYPSNPAEATCNIAHQRKILFIFN
jgi:hypothetical protein